jgi:3-hydroxy-3-methylglutaryl CoA synthase
MASEYPRVDGHLSNACYLRALDGCYNRYADRYEKAFGEPFSLSTADYSVFHVSAALASQRPTFALVSSPLNVVLYLFCVLIG